jgi:hypothetical protein
MIDWDIEESLNLGCVEIESDNTIDPSGGEKISHKLSTDRHARLVLAILTSVSEERDNCVNTTSASPLGCINHNHEFHKVMIGGRTSRLDDVDIFPADVLINLYEGLTIRKCGDTHVG